MNTPVAISAKGKNGLKIDSVIFVKNYGVVPVKNRKEGGIRNVSCSLKAKTSWSIILLKK